MKRFIVSFFIIDTILHYNMENVPGCLTYIPIDERFSPGFPVGLIIILAVFTRQRVLLIHLKHLMYVIIVVESLYLIWFMDFTFNIRHVIITQTSERLMHGFS